VVPVSRAACCNECAEADEAAVQRVADFEIRGRHRDVADFANIYFEKDAARIGKSERPKVAAAIANFGAATPLFLDAYRSEDEPVGLADIRAERVSKALRTSKPPHTGGRTKRNQAPLAEGRIDYRQIRKVEIQPPVGGPLAAAPPPRAPAALVRPCGGALAAAQPRALAMLATAIAQLAAPNAAVQGQLSTFFGGATGIAAAATIRGHLTNLRTHISTEIGPAGTVACHTELDGRCDAPAYNVGVGPTAVMTLCPAFLDDPGAVENNADTLIHEAAHGTTGLATRDLAYGHTRLIHTLPTADALTNTDSYVLLVRNIVNGVAGVPLRPGGVAGDATPGLAGPNVAPARIALAHTEKWLTQSYQDVADAYATVVASIAAGAWTGATAAFDRETVALLAHHFGLTNPGVAAPFALPTVADKIRLAAIHDRFLAMRSVMWGQGITMRPGSAKWAPGPGRQVRLPGSFFALADDKARTRRMILLIVSAHPAISAALRVHYVDAADAIRTHRGLGPP
jgi:hypothetical protein